MNIDSLLNVILYKYDIHNVLINSIWTLYSIFAVILLLKKQKQKKPKVAFVISLYWAISFTM